MNEEIIPTIMEEPEEIIDTINEDVVVLGVESLNGETGDLTLKTINGNELLGEGDIEILAGVTSVNGETGDVEITAEGIGAATSSDLETEISNRELADSNLQTAINGKQDQLSQTQLDAVDSGIDSVKVGQISTNTSNISSLSSSKQDKLSQSQLDAVNSGIDSSKVGQIVTNANDISSIEGKIPTQASSENQLADKNFVNSSVATNTAYYISDNGEPFDSLADLEAYSGDLTNNDYAFVVGTDSAGNTTYTRYKYNADTGEWAEEYVLNNSSFTASQWDTINSGITSGDVSKLAGIEAGAQVNVQPDWSETDNAADDFIKNKPTIPSYSAFVGTDGTQAGTTGLVPAPATTDADKFLKSDGTWDTAGSSITVEQSTGTSQTSVMSQQAVSQMIFPAGEETSKEKIAIGKAATASSQSIAIGGFYSSLPTQAGANSSIAIGSWARLSAANGGIAIGANTNISGEATVALGRNATISSKQGAVALGAYANPTSVGEVNIGSTNASYGYSSSNYRLLSGVYDGQSAHDACTKGQLDTAVGNVESILQTLNSGNGAV